jgi:hypothetical protein
MKPINTSRRNYRWMPLASTPSSPSSACMRTTRVSQRNCMSWCEWSKSSTWTDLPSSMGAGGDHRPLAQLAHQVGVGNRLREIAVQRLDHCGALVPEFARRRALAVGVVDRGDLLDRQLDGRYGPDGPIRIAVTWSALFTRVLLQQNTSIEISQPRHVYDLDQGRPQ